MIVVLESAGQWTVVQFDCHCRWICSFWVLSHLHVQHTSAVFVYEQGKHSEVSPSDIFSQSQSGPSHSSSSRLTPSPPTHVAMTKKVLLELAPLGVSLLAFNGGRDDRDTVVKIV